MGEEPFRDVNYHAMILAPDGRRMSKSLGTGIDPTNLIAEYGADATRYGLLKMASTQDVRFSQGAIEEGAKLANKLWNAARLILANAGEVQPEARPRDLEERWIFARINAARAELESSIAEFEFSPATSTLYHLTFDDFCDWYAEAIKPRLYAADEDARATALAALERLLELLHPVMPHVSEEIWSHLPARESRLILAPWPEPDDQFSGDLHALDRVQEAASVYARSGVKIELDEDEQRIFDAKRVQAGSSGDAQAEIDRLEKEVARAEGMLANERFTSKAPPEVVEAERDKLARYRRELDALRD
jgi:valyl-tRNA synthetase